MSANAWRHRRQKWPRPVVYQAAAARRILHWHRSPRAGILGRRRGR